MKKYAIVTCDLADKYHSPHHCLSIGTRVLVKEKLSTNVPSYLCETVPDNKEEGPTIRLSLFEGEIKFIKNKPLLIEDILD